MGVGKSTDQLASELPREARRALAKSQGHTTWTLSWGGHSVCHIFQGVKGTVWAELSWEVGLFHRRP